MKKLISTLFVMGALVMPMATLPSQSAQNPWYIRWLPAITAVTTAAGSAAIAYNSCSRGGSSQMDTRNWAIGLGALGGLTGALTGLGIQKKFNTLQKNGNPVYAPKTAVQSIIQPLAIASIMGMIAQSCTERGGAGLVSRRGFGLGLGLTSFISVDIIKNNTARVW